jgi:hypothetical protein
MRSRRRGIVDAQSPKRQPVFDAQSRFALSKLLTNVVLKFYLHVWWCVNWAKCWMCGCACVIGACRLLVGSSWAWQVFPCSIIYGLGSSLSSLDKLQQLWPGSLAGFVWSIFQTVLSAAVAFPTFRLLGLPRQTRTTRRGRGGRGFKPHVTAGLARPLSN